MKTQEPFALRHIGPRDAHVEDMAQAAGFDSLDALITATVPDSIRMAGPLQLPEGLSEAEYLAHVAQLAEKNRVVGSYIGMGYYPTVVPPVIQRNILENPGWYTAYTPYQAEIAQGRLEALLNFQTMVSDLTGMEIANASLLDEGTAAAEAMIMFWNTRSRAQVKGGAKKFFVSDKAFPQTLEVMRTRAELLGVELVEGDYNSFTFDAETFGAFVQYPDGHGAVRDYRSFVEAAHAVEAKVAVASDLMALALLEAPGNWGADCVLGNSQRFGVPMGYGGPHAAFFATREAYKRHIPGRIIGVTKDRHGNAGYRMALQTREQHIRREKATSNICTAQALLAVMAGMYAVYHGAEGIRHRAAAIHSFAAGAASALEAAGVNVVNDTCFDTLTLAVASADQTVQAALDAGFNIRRVDGQHVAISMSETTTEAELNALLSAIAGKDVSWSPCADRLGQAPRSVDYLTHEVFNTYRSESEMMRYMKRLENRDLSLVHSMISLGSCTMKLNAASELMPITWPAFANMHPFAPLNQAAGYQEMLTNLHDDLCEATGFAGMSLQPNSGAQGEYTGLLVIRAYHADRGESHRDICLIPSSAHGTNPASAVMAGMKVVVVKCDEAGNVDVDDLRAKAEAHSANLGALMVTYPSTHGVFESAIKEITSIVHEHGGQVYMDGANMNAQVGLTSPGLIGADVCHLNLHKTFAIPHGGGGPGMGPIGVAAHLVPFLPGHQTTGHGNDKSSGAVAAAPFGSALILLISYGYIKMLGAAGLKRSTEIAILNANYMRARLDEHYPILYTGVNGNVAHEMIIDCREFKNDIGIEVADIAKRLMDYGFHAPTVSFPVAGTMMIEPTESESREELDRFCDAMIAIRKEIANVAMGLADMNDNVLKNAPHTAAEVTDDGWSHSYSRREAAYPLSYIAESKFWPAVGRVDDAFGDRNLMCTCPSPEMFAEPAEGAKA